MVEGDVIRLEIEPKEKIGVCPRCGRVSNRPHQSLAYLTHIEYIERELAKIRSQVLPMVSQHIFLTN